MTTISIDTAELRAARAVVRAADPSETDLEHGVAVSTEGGSRWWSAWGDDVFAETKMCDDESQRSSVVLVSRRVVELAASLSEQGDDVVLTFWPAGTTVSNGIVSSTFAAPAPRVVFSPIEPFEVPGARATASARSLHSVFSTGRILPAGVDLGRIAPPPFDVSITDGTIVGSVDWTAAGASAVRIEVDAATTGAGATTVAPGLVADVLRQTEPSVLVTLTIPDGESWVELTCSSWTARIWAMGASGGDGTQDHSDGGEAFPLIDTISVQGGLRPDPLSDATLSDVRAFAIDPDVSGRLAAAASRWNWDLRLQLALASDPDERVVLTLLDATDPYRETCQVMIDGPHVAARRVLAGRNLITPLLEQLARDADPDTRGMARCVLAARGVVVADTEVAR